MTVEKQSSSPDPLKDQEKQGTVSNASKLQRAPTMAEIFTENTSELDPTKWQDNNYLDGLVGSIAPGKIYPTEAVDEIFWVLRNHHLLEQDVLEDFALNTLEALANYPFKIHSDMYGAKIEQHCRVMAAAIHAIYDSGIKSLQKEEHQGIYDSVIKFCNFCEKQDMENDNVRFKLAEIRNGLTIIETDESLVLVIFERAQNIVNAAKAAYAGNYIEAIQDFIEGCKFKLPEARWFDHWIQIRAAQYTCRQLLFKYDEIKNFNAVPMEFFALLKTRAEETMKKGAITKMKKMTSKFSHFISHVSGSAETDEPGCLIFGILDVLQDILATQIKGQLMDGTRQLASDVLFWSGSSFVRSKAAEVLIFIKQIEPSQSNDVDDILQRFRKGLPDQMHQRKFDTLLKRVNLSLEIRFQLRSSQRRHTALHMSQEAQDKLSSSNGLAVERAQQERDKPQPMSLDPIADSTNNSPEAKTQRIRDFKFDPPSILLQCEHTAPIYIESAAWSTGKVLCDTCKKDIELDAIIAAKMGNAQALQVFLQQKGESPDKTDSNGYTLAQCALLWSINPGPVLKVLVAAGANMNVFIENFDNGHYIEHHKSLLHLAASNDGNVDALDILLRTAKINPNIQDGEGRTAAHDICYKTPEPYKGLALLLRQALDINLRHKDNRTPAFQLLERCPDPKEALNSFRLMLNAGIDLSFVEEELCQNVLAYICSFCPDSYELLELALRNKSEPNQQDVEGRTPIYFLMLSWSKQSKALELLSQYGANFNIKDSYGFSPVSFFARSPCTDVIESLAILTKNNIDIKELDPQGNTAIHGAAYESTNAAAMIKALVDLGVDINAVGYSGLTAVHLAVTHEIPDVGLEATRKLIDLGAKINIPENNGFSSLHYACFSVSSIECARILLESGAQVNARSTNGSTPIHIACQSTDPMSFFQLLLEFGADPTIKTNDQLTLLHALAQRKDSPLESIRFVKEIGIDMSAVTSPSHGGFNAAHLAALWMSNPEETIWFLLDCGINPDARTTKGANILHYLTDTASALPLFKKLITKGADPNCKCSDGETLLHKVAQNSNSPIEWLEFLIDDCKIDYNLNAETEQGDTPITYLASNWITPGVFEWCVAHGANPVHRNKQNHSVFALAAQFLQFDAVEYLYNKYPEFQTRMEIQTAIDLVEQLKVEKSTNGEDATIIGSSETTEAPTEETKTDINTGLAETSETNALVAADSNPTTEPPIAPEDENTSSNKDENQTSNDQTAEEEGESDGSKPMLEMLKGWLKSLPEDIIQ